MLTMIGRELGGLRGMDANTGLTFIALRETRPARDGWRCRSSGSASDVDQMASFYELLI